MRGVRYLLGIQGVVPLVGIVTAIAFSLGSASLYYLPHFGMRDTVARLAPYKKAFDLQGAALDVSEISREEEAGQAVDAVEDERQSCESSMAALRGALVRALAQLEEERAYDQAGCPVRRIVPVGELFGDGEGPGHSPAGTGEDGPEDLRGAPG